MSLSPTIPIERIVKVTPSSLGAATGAGFINGLILTQNVTVLPAGELRSYADPTSVAKDFSANSIEAQMASAYFGGYVGNLQTPATLHFYGCAAHDGAESQAAVASLATVMENVLDQTQDFAGFTTSFEPVLADKQALAKWTAGKADRFWYVPWDTDAQAIIAGSQCFGTWLQEQMIDGTTIVYKDPAVAAFCLGWMASLDFDATEGRATLAGRSSPVASPTDGNAADYDALISNGYSVYGAFGNGLGRWNLLQNGSVSGQFKWADSYINQIWLNASLQANLINLITNTGTIPYNTEGDGLMSAAISNTRAQARTFGAVRAGVTISDAQKAQLQRLFGRDVSSELFNSGDCFRPGASTAPSDVRVARKSPPAIYAWCDGQSVQSITLSSIQVQ